MRPPNDAIALLLKDPARVEAAKQRLGEEIDRTSPNLIVSMGNTPLRLLTGLSGIGSLHGHCLLGTLRPVKVLPVKHPAVVFRDPTARTSILMDFFKAKREMEFPELRYTAREIWIEPNLSDLLTFEGLYIEGAQALAIDIETVSSPVRQITCIGFAPDPNHALVVPLADQQKPGFHYWEEWEEKLAWEWMQRQFSRPLPKVLQNGTYDLHWLSLYGFRVQGPHEDTMLLHHSMYSELEKGLEALAATYANSPPWKTLRPRGTDEKREG